MRNLFHITIYLVTLNLFILEISGKTNTSDNRNKRISGPKLRGNVVSNINLRSDKKGKIIRGSNDQVNKNFEDVLEQSEKSLVSENGHSGLHINDSPKETIFIKEDKEGQIHSELNPESSEDNKDLNDNDSKDKSSDIISVDNKSNKRESDFQSLSDLELLDNSSQDNLENETISTEPFPNQKHKGLQQEENEEPLEPLPTQIYKDYSEENSEPFPKQEHKNVDKHNEKNTFHESVSVNINQENLKPKSLDETLNINSKKLEDQLDLHEHDNSERLKDEEIGNEPPVHENLSVPNDSIDQILNQPEQVSNDQEQLHNEKQKVEEKSNYQISSVDLKEPTNEDILPHQNVLENIKQNESEINHVHDHVLPKENTIDKLDNQKEHIDELQHNVNVLQENNINDHQLETKEKPNIESFEPKNIDLEIVLPENVEKEEKIVDVSSPKHLNHESFEVETSKSEHKEVVSEKRVHETVENEESVSEESNPETAEKEENNHEEVHQEEILHEQNNQESGESKLIDNGEGAFEGARHEFSPEKNDSELNENEFVESEKSEPEPAENEEKNHEEVHQEEILPEQNNEESGESKLVDYEEDVFEEAHHGFSSEKGNAELNENEFVESDKSVSEPDEHEEVVSEESKPEESENEEAHQEEIVPEQNNQESDESKLVDNEEGGFEKVHHEEFSSEKNDSELNENEFVESEKSVSEPAEHVEIVSEKSNNEPDEHVQIVSEQSNNEPAENEAVPDPSKPFEEFEKVDSQPKIVELQIIEPNVVNSQPSPQEPVEPTFVKIEKVPSEENKHGNADPEVEEKANVSEVLEKEQNPQESVEEIPLKKDESEVVHPEIIEIEKIEPEYEFEEIPVDEDEFEEVKTEQLDLEHNNLDSEILEVQEIPSEPHENAETSPEIVEIDEIFSEPNQDKEVQENNEHGKNGNVQHEIVEVEKLPPEEDKNKNVQHEIVEVEEVVPEKVEIEVPSQSNNNENIEPIKPEEKNNELSVVEEKAISQEPVEPTLNENEEVAPKPSGGESTKPDIVQIKIVQENESNKKETPVVDHSKHVEESVQDDDNDEEDDDHNIDFEGFSRKDDEKDSSNKNKNKSSFITYISTKKFKKVSQTIVSVMINAYDGVIQVVSTIKGIAKDIVIFFQNI
ncbi:glutamate-rich protein, putative [Plasmodium sp. DRC-Itaito]|nr:glutamate-rich protein, putative [Plasmodium sp. DRC-Itaito]